MHHGAIMSTQARQELWDTAHYQGKDNTSWGRIVRGEKEMEAETDQLSYEN